MQLFGGSEPNVGTEYPFMDLQKRPLQERCEELVNLGTLGTLGHKNACTGKAELGCVWVELVVGPAAQRSAVTTEPRQRSERSGDTTRKTSLFSPQQQFAPKARYEKDEPKAHNALSGFTP